MAKIGADYRQRAWDLLEVAEDPSTGRVQWDWVDVLLLVTVTVSVLSVIAESVAGIRLRYGPVLAVIDYAIIAIFTVEYAARLWACGADPRYRHLKGRIRYVTTFYSVVDLTAILPAYAALLLPVHLLDLRFVRVLRLMRFARVLKLGRYSESLDRVKHVFAAKRADLGVALFGVLIVLVLASSLMYYVENSAQPEVFASIPDSMWWGVTTLTTVGYGDMQPVTPIGKLLGGAIQLLGIAVFALPAGILASGYQEECARHQQTERV